MKQMENYLMEAEMENNIEKTMKISSIEMNALGIKSVIAKVYKALEEKGYEPISQIVGYIMSADPSYITSHNEARTLIQRIERDDLLEEFVRNYVASL